jgi:hypothetical protein
VSIQPGAIAFTRTPLPLHSVASVRTRPRYALFAPEYATTSGSAKIDAIDAMNTILPLPCSNIDGATARLILNAPNTCVSKTFRNSSSVVSAAGFLRWIPALLMRIVGAPNFEVTCATMPRR